MIAFAFAIFAIAMVLAPYAAHWLDSWMHGETWRQQRWVMKV